MKSNEVKSQGNKSIWFAMPYDDADDGDADGDDDATSVERPVKLCAILRPKITLETQTQTQTKPTNQPDKPTNEI